MKTGLQDIHDAGPELDRSARKRRRNRAYTTGPRIDNRLTPHVTKTDSTPEPPEPRCESGLIGKLEDLYGRRIDHLRISVTSACDLRCIYCRPAQSNVEASDISDSQRLEFIRFLYDRYGLSQVRITGGEPLLYGRLPQLIETIKHGCPGIRVALTSNGRMFSQCARALRRAGLDRWNLSLDSLDEATYRRITGGRLPNVLRGLDDARSKGFPPPKINTVVLRGINDREVVDLASWAISHGSEIRFLEAMPIGPTGIFNKQHFVPASEVRSRLAVHFDLTPVTSPRGSTASRFMAVSKTLMGIVGTIAPITEPFCSSCRRIRLTADGRLFPCLLDRFSVDIRAGWNGGFDQKAMTRLLELASRSKRESGTAQSVSMIQLGG